MSTNFVLSTPQGWIIIGFLICLERERFHLLGSFLLFLFNVTEVSVGAELVLEASKSSVRIGLEV